MIHDPNLILYACIATGTTVLAEFKSRDHDDLGSLALRCLAKTPPFHTFFTHTIRGRTYAFLIDQPFTYFSIFDEKLETSEGLAFLRSVKQSFDNIGDDNSARKRLDSLASHCFQGEFNPVFHHLLAGPMVEHDDPNSPETGAKLGHQSSGSLESSRGKVPLLLGDVPKEGLKKKKKKKKGFFEGMVSVGRGGGRDGERRVDVCDESVGTRSLSKEFSVIMHRNGDVNNEPALYQKHAKKAWKKHVWVVLSLDLIVCMILFVVWLWVCRGFKCVDG